MSQLSSRTVALATAPNMRTLGGLEVSGGRIREGLIFRSATLAHLSETDGLAFAELGIKLVFDLRTKGECAAQPDRLPAGIDLVNLDVLADSPVDLAASMAMLDKDPAATNAMLAGGKAVSMLEHSYCDIVSQPSARWAYRTFFETLSEPGETLPALFHCTTGKDRTGWAAAALLLLLGADDETVRADYLQTNVDLLPALTPLLDKASAAGIDPDLLLPVLSVQESFLDAALGEVEKRFGSMQGYFTEGLGLSECRIDALRERFVVAN
ncbi:tyrosine-protein phosphatase [Leucobacter sp. cx-42]|uniref:tyrosine-protein phosphatase n=1 Tax=unclassified Leucobacter TaxID=2621730 RepID=UPI00165EB2FA|nr:MULTISPECIES: tyrosine-protein phosphatase [unclassified Leucobacter]MBC9954701.1 tyrosine-protein phosphatase [Leucobacter sp. cx-42]